LPVHGSGFFHVLQAIAEQTGAGLGKVVVVATSAFGFSDAEEWRGRAT